VDVLILDRFRHLPEQIYELGNIRNVHARIAVSKVTLTQLFALERLRSSEVHAIAPKPVG
jgi:hypothetical protein